MQTILCFQHLSAWLWAQFNGDDRLRSWSSSRLLRSNRWRNLSGRAHLERDQSDDLLQCRYCRSRTLSLWIAFDDASQLSLAFSQWSQLMTALPCYWKVEVFLRHIRTLTAWDLYSPGFTLTRPYSARTSDSKDGCPIGRQGSPST